MRKPRHGELTDCTKTTNPPGQSRVGTGTRTSRLPARGSLWPNPTQFKSSDDFLSTYCMSGLSWVFSCDLPHLTQATSPVVEGFLFPIIKLEKRREEGSVLSKVTESLNPRTRILNLVVVWRSWPKHCRGAWSIFSPSLPSLGPCSSVKSLMPHVGPWTPPRTLPVPSLPLSVLSPCAFAPGKTRIKRGGSTGSQGVRK